MNRLTALLDKAKLLPAMVRLLFAGKPKAKQIIEDHLAPVVKMTQDAIDNADCRKVRAIMHHLSPDATKLVMSRLDNVSCRIVTTCVAMGAKP
jgi:hypothetical protein